MTNVKTQAQELIKGLLGEGFTYAEIAASHALAKESPRAK